MEPTPRHVLCIIGKWRDFSLIKNVLRHSYEDFTLDEEFSILAPDERMPAAFDASALVGNSSLTKHDLEGVLAHTAVAYILSPPLQKHLARNLSGRALHLIAKLLKEGAVAAKSDSAGLAHGRERWLELAAKHRNAIEVSDLHSVGATLYSAWVQRPIHDQADSIFYSVGMHLLGEPDTEIAASPDFEVACEWLDLMGLYVVADNPSRPILDGEGFRLTERGPRRLIRKRPCKRYDADHFFFNPYGYNRLVEPP